MAVLPSSGAPFRGLSVPGPGSPRTGALLGGGTAIGRPGRSRFVVAAIVFFLSQYVLAESEGEWLDRPGNVAVCAGFEANLPWTYSESFGDVEAVFVSKLPGYVVLIKKLGHSDPVSIMNRTSLLVNGHFTFRLQNVTKADEGIYNLEVLFVKTGVLHDKASLRVIDDADCPNFHRYNNPVVYEVVPVDANRGYLYFSHNRTFMFSKPGNVTLGTIIPAADPPVNTQLSTADANCSCRGEKRSNSHCECDFYVDGDDVQEMQIKMTFVAYEESMTRIALGTIASGNAAKPTTTRNETGRNSRPNYVNESLLAATVTLSLLLTLSVGLIIGWLIRSYRTDGRRTPHAGRRPPLAGRRPPDTGRWTRDAGAGRKGVKQGKAGGEVFKHPRTGDDQPSDNELVFYETSEMDKPSKV